jgi:hypothetical protein
VNGGPFVAGPGTVNNRDRIRVQQTSSASGGIATIATLNVGGRNVPFSVTTVEPGAALTGLWTRSFPGEFIGQGKTQFAHAPEWIVNFTRPSPDLVQVNLNGPGGASWALSFAAAQGAALVAGPYEGAARTPYRGNSPGLEVSANYSGLQQDQRTIRRARSRLRQSREPAIRGQLRAVLRFHAGAARRRGAHKLLRCRSISSSPRRTRRPTRWRSRRTSWRLRARRSPRIRRRSTGSCPTGISIFGGTYSVNGGPFVSASGTVNNLDHVRVRLTSSGAGNTLTTAILNIGGVSVPFHVTTIAIGAPVTALWVKSYPGDYIGLGQDRLRALRPSGLRRFPRIPRASWW